jgi:hypothetical protein
MKVFGMKMGKLPSVPIGAGAAIAKLDFAAADHPLERGLGLVGKRPGLEIRAAEGQLRRLDSHEANLAAVGKNDGVAVDDAGHPGAPA